MTIAIKSVPQEKIRAKQAGDWWINQDAILVHVLETLSLEDQLRVAVHELIEAFLCRRDKVTDESVCGFDEQYEKEREEGKHKEDDEPGDDPRAPYREQHMAATHVERACCHVLNIPFEINWFNFPPAQPFPLGQICPRCHKEIKSGEEFHPTITPFHVQCHEHNQCYTLCSHINKLTLSPPAPQSEQVHLKT